MKIKILTLSSALILSFSNFSFGQEKEVNFEKNYINSNNNKTTIEINEVQELIYIILSITDFGTTNPNMTNQNTEYFKDVKSHFSQYSNLPIVEKFDKQLKKTL